MRITMPCNCEVCLMLRSVDRNFEAKMIRIGRKHGIDNRRLLRPMIGIWDEDKGELVYVRLPYGFEG